MTMDSEPGSAHIDTNEATEAASEPVLDYGPAAPRRDFKTIVRRLGPAGPLALIAASLPAIGGFTLLGTLKWTGPWLEAHGELGILIYVVGFTVLAGLALLPTYAQAVLAGYVFQLWVGSAAALFGIAGAAIVGYLVARKASGNRVVELIEEQPRWRAVYDALVRCGRPKALLIVTLLRIPPNSPFAITNLVLAACRVRFVTYIVGTVVGIAPRTILAVFIGSQATELDFSKPGDKWFFIGGIVVTLIVVGIIGALANQAITKVTANGKDADGDDAES